MVFAEMCSRRASSALVCPCTSKVAAARAYSKIAPSAPHALHMPSHIFTRLGLWEDSIASNELARAAAHDAWIADGRCPFCRSHRRHASRRHASRGKDTHRDPCGGCYILESIEFGEF